MQVQLTSKFRVYSGIALAAIMATLALGRFEYILIGLPFLLGLIEASLESSEPGYEGEVSASTEQCFEGSTVRVWLTVRARSHIHLLEIRHVLVGKDGPAELVDVKQVTLSPGEAQSFTWDVLLPMRGVYRVGEIELRALTRSGMKWVSHRVLEGRKCVVYPEIKVMSCSGPRARLPRLSVGEYVSKSRGEGTELLDIREYTPSDKTSRINWLTSLRTGTLHVTDRSMERNADIVIVLDVLADLGVRPGSYLDLSARAAGSIAAHYLRRRDRVGLIEYGAFLNWIVPKSGRNHLHAILRRLAGLSSYRSYVFRTVQHIPRQVLPPEALLIVITPLLDERSFRLIADLASRGYDMAVVYIPPERVFSIPRQASEAERLAFRWWIAERKGVIRQVQRLGVPVGIWDGESPLELALLQAGRRRLGA